MTKFSIVHPSRGRPEICFETVKRWIERATTDFEYIVSIDKDDPCNADYILEIGRFYGEGELPVIYNLRIIENANRSAIDAVNNAAKVATGDILIVMSDDFDCPDNWDKLILEAVGGEQDWVLKTQDGAQPWIITLPIMDRKYYERFGYVYFPEYSHMFADTELTHVADYLGRKLTSDILFKHNHYTITGKHDETSRRADKTWQQGESLYLERLKSNFGITDIKGQCTAQHHIEWLKTKGFELHIKPILSICIPTVFGREKEFERLYKLLSEQVMPYNVEILWAKDNKEISIGKKRQQLLDAVKGEFIVFFDDDDLPAKFYVRKIVEAIQKTPDLDCIGFLELCTMDGEERLACHSNRFDKWGDNIKGFHYARTIFNKDPVKTSIARQIGFSDVRYAEDEDFAIRLKASGLLKKEVFINDILYYYFYNTQPLEAHNKRYGISN